MKIIVTFIAAIIALLPLTTYAQPVVTTTTSATSVPQYGVYEITMNNSGTYTYPDEDVVISCTFTAPSGKTYTVGGFNYDTGVWKVRFAPFEVGAYTWSLTFTTSAGTYSTNGNFTGTASTSSGFLITDPNNNHRLVTMGDGKPFFVNGYQYGIIDSYHPSPMGGPTDDTGILVPLVNSFGIYYRAGINIWRYNWQDQDAGNNYLTRLNSGSSGKNLYSTSEGKRIDELLMDERAAGLKHMQTMSIGSLTTNWDTTSTGNATALANYYHHFINRWGAYTDIWELGNELNGYTQAYLNIYTQTLQTYDPYQHPCTNTYPAGGSSIDESGLTASNTHTYRASTNLVLDQGWVISSAGSSTAWGQYIGATVSGVYYPSQREYYPSKPIYSGECGNASPYGTYDPERYRIPIWTTELNDSGTIYWAQYNRREQYPGGYSNMYMATEERAMNKVLANLRADLDDQITPVATASVVCNPSASMRGYCASSSTNLIGYFLHTTSHASTLSGATVTIPVPANNMRGQWVDPATGTILQEFTVNSGTQTLNVPTFQVDVGLRLRPASTAPIIEVARASYITFENQGSVTITVNRSNNSSGAVSVNYATSDGLAVAGTNYTGTSGTLTWADGDMTPKTFTVQLQDDGVATEDLDFMVNLSSPTGGAALEGNVTSQIAECDDSRNFTPLISSALTLTTNTSTAVNYTILGTGSPTSFGASPLPTGLSVNSATGALTGTVTTAGTFNITITATNVWGTASNTLVLTVNPPAPVINSALTASATTTSAFNYQITATNSPTSFNATNLPPGLSVSTSTGLISGTPTQVGTFAVTISATNVTGTGSATLTITVTTPGAPVISSATSVTGTVGSAFNYSVVANNSPSSYGATNLPPGLNINTTSGVITGTPTTSGVYYATLSAVNSTGTGVAYVNFTIYQTTGGVQFAYEGFNYASGSTISTATEISPSAFGWSGAWSTTQKVVAPGLTYSGITPIGNCLDWSSNVNPVRSFNINVAPAGTTKVDTDGAIRIGNPGSTIWIRALLEALPDSAAGDACAVELTGLGSGGGIKIGMGNMGSTASANEGYWSVYHSTTAGNNGKSTVAITASQVVMLVARLSYGTGTNTDEIDFYVNPPVGSSPPATPDVVLKNISIGLFDKVTFAGFRACYGDELSLGTDWLSAVQPSAIAPVITSNLTATGNGGAAFTYNITASNTPTSYGASGLPSGLTVSTSTGAITGTPTVTGTFNVSLSAGNSAGTGTANLVLTVNPPATFGSWTTYYGLTGNNALATANPSGDGIVNLLKYALGLDPTVMTSAITNGTTPGLPWVYIQGNNLCMLYQKDTTKTDISYHSQVSTDLTNWGATGITETVQSTSGNIQTIQASVPMSTNTRQFMRLQITQP